MTMTKIQPDLLSGSDDFPVAFGRYTLLGVLGEGGMARVFRAELQGLEGVRKKAAIKIIRASVAASNQNLGKALVNEARLGGLLHHPNVVETYEYGVVDDLPFIAMEYVRGVGLDELLEHGYELSPGHLLEMSAQIAAGLDHAHNLEDSGIETELVHRDLKPSNILLSRDGLVKVMDFGIAKAAALSTSMTQTGMTKGTPAYMSPEQVAGDPLDRRSDIFAFGAILYELALGSRMFGGDSLMTVLAAVLQVEERLERSDSRSRLDAVVPGLADIVFRCMRKDPADRYREAAEAEDALKALLRRQEPGDSLRSFVRGILKERNHGVDSIRTDSGVEVAPTLATPDAALVASRVSPGHGEGVGPTVAQAGYEQQQAHVAGSAGGPATSGDASAGSAVGAVAVSDSMATALGDQGLGIDDTRTVAPDTALGAAVPAVDVPATRLVPQGPPPTMSTPPPTPASGTPSQADGTLWATPQTRKSALQVLLVGLGVGLLLAIAVGAGGLLLWTVSQSETADQTPGEQEQDQDAAGALGGFDSFPVDAGEPRQNSGRQSRGSAGPGENQNRTASGQSRSLSGTDRGASNDSGSSARAEEVLPPPAEPLPDVAEAEDAVVLAEAGNDTEAEPEPAKPTPVAKVPPSVPEPVAAPAPATSPSSATDAAVRSRNTSSKAKYLHMDDLQGQVVERTSRGTRIRFKGRILGATEGRAILYYNPPKARWLKQKMDCGRDRWCSTVISLEGVSKGRIVYYVSVKGRRPDGQEKMWRSEEADFRIKP